MRQLLLAAVMFGLGVYVGRPAQIVVDSQIIKDCTILAPVGFEPAKKAEASMNQNVVHMDQKPVQEAGQVSSPADAQRPEEAEDRKREREAEAAGVDPDELPIADPKAWAEKGAKELANGVVRMGGWPTAFTFTAEEYKHISELRDAIPKQGLKIIKEEPMNIGKYVYKIVVAGADYREKDPE